MDKKEKTGHNKTEENVTLEKTLKEMDYDSIKEQEIFLDEVEQIEKQHQQQTQAIKELKEKGYTISIPTLENTNYKPSHNKYVYMGYKLKLLGEKRYTLSIDLHVDERQITRYYNGVNEIPKDKREKLIKKYNLPSDYFDYPNIEYNNKHKAENMLVKYLSVDYDIVFLVHPLDTETSPQKSKSNKPLPTVINVSVNVNIKMHESSEIKM